ncbi:MULTISPECIES: CrcB family protein [Brevibacterium]|uniref:Fluoride-specific ion channel FluC n=1 Tax=Brevibacterium antiquum CNRZ 918 TaxID=1255637 RepID=A0A2H1KXA6_9MICO|nr:MULTISPECIES: CrcB family protein [Brevibacterium]SMY03852.1 CrcB protein [Brevibacterium antiquum CNRZ 918]HCG54713.1 CrcB family protein [Brevibacterium sp.]
MSRPVHLRLPYLGLALLGGTAGTAARESLGLLVPPGHDIPFAILTVNVIGAFLLGLLLDALARRGPDEGRRRRMRIMVGTGFMGGFTTYSALATDTALLLGAGAPGIGLVYAIATLLLGGLATWAGIAAATLAHSRRPNPTHRPGASAANTAETGGGK